jgi:hypothetical protein
LPARRQARDTADSSAAFALGELASGAYQWWRRHDEYDVWAEEEAEISSAMAADRALGARLNGLELVIAHVGGVPLT